MSLFELVLLWLAGASVWVQAAVHVFALEMVELLSLPLSKHNQQKSTTRELSDGHSEKGKMAK
jgi:hypothetical protein